ncbi:MAG: LysR substrate-binding domain-containing protein [Commensalibacter sp.]
MVSSIERGIGIGALPKYVAVNRPNLIQILKNIDVPLVKLYLVYPQELRTSKKIRAFGDFIIREFNKHFD